MKVCYIDQTTTGRDGMITALQEKDWILTSFPAPSAFDPEQGSYDKVLTQVLQNQTPDCVFSFDFLPEVSLVCSKEKIPYVSWTVNMPAAGLFSDLAKDPVNRLFAIDSALCETLKGSGIKVTYLPPAADPDLLFGIAHSPMNDLPDMDVSYVGPNRVMEEESFLDHVAQKDLAVAGKLRDLMHERKFCYDLPAIEKKLPEDILSGLHKALPLQIPEGSLFSASYLYAAYFLYPSLTEIERGEMLDSVSLHLGDVANLHVFPDSIGNLAPYIYSKSLINLLLPPRTYEAALPMEALEIMGSKGFLLCPHQADAEKLFVPGKEIVLFASKEDLLTKISYYLEHGEERREIAARGLERIRAEHTFAQRLEVLFSAL